MIKWPKLLVVSLNETLEQMELKIRMRNIE
jgi:hypothetical protein